MLNQHLVAYKIPFFDMLMCFFLGKNIPLADIYPWLGARFVMALRTLISSIIYTLKLGRTSADGRSPKMLGRR
jgi:hypothetical protein